MGINRSSKVGFFKFLEHHEYLVAWFGLLLALSGGIFAYFEYNKAEESKRIDRVLTLVSEYYTGGNDSLKAKLTELSDVSYESLSIDIPKGATRQARRAMLSEKRLELLKEHTDSVIALYDFYSRVSLCSRKDICDFDTAFRYFGRDILAFINSSCELILEREVKWKSDLSTVLFSFLMEKNSLNTIAKADPNAESYFFCERFRALERAGK